MFYTIQLTDLQKKLKIKKKLKILKPKKIDLIDYILK